MTIDEAATTGLPSREARQARGAVAVLFFTNGALFANILPRYPTIKDHLGLTNAEFGLAGFGVATLIPTAMHAADELPGLRPGAGLTIVGWLLRLAFLVSPPVVGAIADATSLRLGLAVAPLAGILVLLSSRVLAGAHRPRSPQGVSCA